MRNGSWTPSGALEPAIEYSPFARVCVDAQGLQVRRRRRDQYGDRFRHAQDRQPAAFPDLAPLSPTSEREFLDCLE